MAKKKKAQEGKERKGPPASQSVPDRVIVVMFKNGVPQLQTSGELQTWHFMTAVAFLEGIILQNVLMKSLQEAKAMEAAIQQGRLVPSGLVLP